MSPRNAQGAGQGKCPLWPQETAARPAQPHFRDRGGSVRRAASRPVSQPSVRGPRNRVLRRPSIPCAPPLRAASGVASIGGWRRSGPSPLCLTPSRSLGQHGGCGGGSVLREPPEWRLGARRQGRGSYLYGWGGSQEKETKEEEEQGHVAWAHSRCLMHACVEWHCFNQTRCFYWAS